MRDWRSYWKTRPTESGDNHDDVVREVGKTVLGEPVSPFQVELIIESICNSLAITEDDYVIDLGCGNGLLTSRLARRVKHIEGFDISEPLIKAATQRYRLENCSFAVIDIAEFDPNRIKAPGALKLFAYEVFQHLSNEEVKRLLQRIFSPNNPAASFFAGSVPDHAKLDMFYDTPERLRLYHENVQNNCEQIGHWWKREEIDALCDELAIDCAFIEQDSRLYTSHYRFNVVFNG